MKKYLQIEPGGGVPLDNELLFLLQDQPFQSIQTLLSTIGSTWVVDGCTVTNVNTSGKTCTVSAGFVYIGSELRPFDGVTSPYPFYIIAAADTYETADFGNGAQQNYLVSKRATITTVLPTNAPYLTVDPSLSTGDDTINKRIRPLLNGDLTAALNKEIKDRADADNTLRSAIADEVKARGDADTQLQTNINALATIVATKQSRITTRVAWTDMVALCGPNGNNSLNPYYTSTENLNDPNSGYNGNILHKFEMMRTEDGFVNIRGYIKGNGGGNIISQNGLPKEFRPTKSVQFTKTYVSQGNTNYPGRVLTTHMVTIDPAGGITHEQLMSQVISNNDNGGFQLIGFHPYFTFDGFSYSVE